MNYEPHCRTILPTNLQSRPMKPFTFQRTPTDLMDELTIYCYRMRKQGKTLYSIAKDVGKDHSTVMHHLRRYDDLMSVDKAFQDVEKEFRVSEFLEKFKGVKHHESN